MALEPHDIKKLFEKHSDEFLVFGEVANKTSRRADMHAFNLIEKLVPGDRDMISSAEHDEIWLSVDPVELANVATEDQIVELIRCGVRYDFDTDSFAMFV